MASSNPFSFRQKLPRKEKGAAFIIMLVILVMGVSAMLVGSYSNTSIKNQRSNTTRVALAQAKDALIGSSISNALRPGSLPCPDTNDDGMSDACSNTNFIGRLPWKTLGLPNLYDSNGEQLWYAVSPNFRNVSTLTTINSDTPTQLTISGNAVMAVIFSPGSPLSSQERNSNSATCPSDGVSKPKNRCVSNYLEGENQDNDSVFVNAHESSSINDQALEITTDQILPRVEKLIANQVYTCLSDYASMNYGRFPWSTLLDPANSPSYTDKMDKRFGRLPDSMPDTKSKSNNNMDDVWNVSSNTCNSIFPSTSGWWHNTNWRELIFYSVSSKHRPKDSTSVPNACSTSCLVVNPPSAATDKKIVVIFAGPKLAGQIRNTNAQKADPANYLEANNATGNTTEIFQQSPTSSTFNDTVLFLQ